MIEKRKEGAERKRSKLILLFILLSLSCASRMPPPGKPDIDPPDIKIISPTNGDTVRGLLSVKYVYSDRSSLGWLGVYIDGRRVMEDSVIRDSILLKVDSLLDTMHTLYLEAKDKWDNLGRSNHIRFFTSGGKRRKPENEGMDREHQKPKEKSR